VPRAAVVIPTRNEEQSIARVIAEVRSGFVGTRYNEVDIVLADDSSDRTRRVARELGAVVVPGGGEGLGVAMYRGLKAAAQLAPDVIIAVDGDGQADAAAEIRRFLAPIERDEADLVIGSRFLDRGLVKYPYRWINRFGTRVLSAFLRAQTGLPLTDSHGGIRAMRPEVAADLDLLGTQTYVQESILDAVEKGYRVTEIASVWRKREHGSSRVVGSIPKYILYTLPILILRSGQHLRLLYSAGLLSMVGGVLYFAIILAQEGLLNIGSRVPGLLLVALLLMSGLQLFFFGFVLQLLKQIKRNVDRNESLTRRIVSPSQSVREAVPLREVVE
jgi:glycosyltransferase involved in cell wall biosynthesis